MAIELHHLHSGHDDELTRLKARIAELEAMNHELEEERRWRKFPDEKADLKPGEAQCVLAVIEYEKNNGKGRYVSEVDYVVEDDGEVTFYEAGYENPIEGDCNVILWRPLPEAPEGK